MTRLPSHLLHPLLALLSGELLTQAHNSPWPALALIALAPAWIAIERTPPRAWLERAGLGALVYAVPPLHMTSLLTWGPHLLAAAAALLVLGGAAFGALTAPLPLHHLAPHRRRLGLIAAFTLSDAARLASPFPTPFGATLADLPPLANLASLGGPLLAAALLAATSLTLAEIIQKIHQNNINLNTKFHLAALALLLAPLLPLHLSAPAIPPPAATPLPDATLLLLLQTAHTEADHRAARRDPQAQDALDRAAADLLAHLPATPTPPDLIAFGETATGRLLPPGDGALPHLRRLASANPTAAPLLFPASQRRPGAADAPLEDAAFLLDPAHPGAPTWRGAKRALTPLAEPGYTPGPAPTLLTLASGERVGVLFCSESLRPDLASDLRQRGATLLLVLANDAGQGASDGAAFHARLTRMRALETGLPLVFIGQSGPAFAVDPQGRRVDLMGLFKRGAAAVYIPRARPPLPLYASTAPLWLALAVGAWALAVAANIAPSSGFFGLRRQSTPSNT